MPFHISRFFFFSLALVFTHTPKSLILYIEFIYQLNVVAVLFFVLLFFIAQNPNNELEKFPGRMNEAEECMFAVGFANRFIVAAARKKKC